MPDQIKQTIHVLMLDAMNNSEHDLATRVYAAQMIIESASERGWLTDDEFYVLSSDIDVLAMAESHITE